MARKSKVLNERAETLQAVLRQLDESHNFHQLMLDLGFDDVDRAKWSRWLSGSRLMSEERAARLLAYTIKFKLLDSKLEEDAALLLHLLDPRVHDIIEGFKKTWTREIEAAEMVMDAWRRHPVRNSKSTLAQDIESIITRNQRQLERAERGDQQILVDAIDFLHYRDGRPDLANIQVDEESLTRYELTKKRATLLTKKAD